MAGNLKRIRCGLEAVADRVLCEVGVPCEGSFDGVKRIEITGAIVLGVLDAQEERIATLEAENARLRAAMAQGEAKLHRLLDDAAIVSGRDDLVDLWAMLYEAQPPATEPAKGKETT